MYFENNKIMISNCFLKIIRQHFTCIDLFFKIQILETIVWWYKILNGENYFWLPIFSPLLYLLPSWERHFRFPHHISHKFRGPVGSKFSSTLSFRRKFNKFEKFFSPSFWNWLPRTWSIAANHNLEWVKTFPTIFPDWGSRISCTFEFPRKIPNPRQPFSKIYSKFVKCL